VIFHGVFVNLVFCASLGIYLANKLTIHGEELLVIRMRTIH